MVMTNSHGNIAFLAIQVQHSGCPTPQGPRLLEKAAGRWYSMTHPWTNVTETLMGHEPQLVISSMYI